MSCLGGESFSLLILSIFFSWSPTEPAESILVGKMAKSSVLSIPGWVGFDHFSFLSYIWRFSIGIPGCNCCDLVLDASLLKKISD